MMIGSTSEFILAEIPAACRRARRRFRRRPADQLGAHVLRRGHQQLEIARLEVAGDVIEQLGDIAAGFGVGGEVAEVGVDLAVTG